jgi:hypothetical protein
MSGLGADTALVRIDLGGVGTTRIVSRGEAVSLLVDGFTAVIDR